MRLDLSAALCALACMMGCSSSGSSDGGARIAVGDPYANVNWQTFSQYRADLHVHTLQSDGCHLPNEVIRAFHDAGFSILSITDHDAGSPNQCPTHDAATPQQIDFGAFADAQSPYPNPRPPTFPSNPTWPWTDFGAPSPSDLGMLGIEGAELTCTYHVNSFFNDYGAPSRCEKAPSKDEELLEVARRGGLTVLNHPFTDNRPLEWYADLYRRHSADSFVGLELAADRPADVAYSVALWDQLLGELMPARPIWGFGTSDMHLLVTTRFAFTVFVLDGLTTEKVKDAMRRGQFYSVVGTKELNFSRSRGQTYDAPTAYDGTYPALRSIVVDRDAGRISIDATGYDEIVWIAKPLASGPSANSSTPWPAGEVVQRGPVFDYAASDTKSPYVRAEVIRHTDDGPIRLFINPFALRRR